MPMATAGIFTVNYTLVTNADPDADIQFGMDFTVTQAGTSGALPLCQLIFPATSVGTNRAGFWNVDNHRAPSRTADSLVFANANGGIITDTPREISNRNRGNIATKFTVYRVDISKNTLQASGVTFGYSINTSDSAPQTVFSDMRQLTLSNEEKQIVTRHCEAIRFA